MLLPFSPSFNFFFCFCLDTVKASYLHCYRNDRPANVPAAILFRPPSPSVYFSESSTASSLLSFLMLGFLFFHCQPCSWTNYIFTVSRRVFSQSSLFVISSASVSMPAVSPYNLETVIFQYVKIFFFNVSWSGYRL